MVVVAHSRSRQAVFAFLAIIVGSSALLPAQNRISTGKPTYKTVGTPVAQAPSWMPAFEPPRATEEAESRWTGPSSPSPNSTLLAPPATSAESPVYPPTPFTFDTPSLLTANDDAIYHDGGMASEMSGWGAEYGMEGYGGEPAPVYSTGTWFWRGNWFAEASFAWWTVEDTRTVELAFDSTVVNITSPNGRLYTTKDSSFRFAPGAKLTLGRFLGRDASNRDHMWELGFLGLLEWETQFSIAANNGEDSLFSALARGFPVVGFTSAHAQTYSYEANFNSFEWNYRINTRPARDQMALQPDGSWVRFKNSGSVTSVIGGFRAMKLGESVNYRSDVVDDEDPTVITEIGDYTVLTNNDLFGPQIGFERRDTYDEWGWGFRTKLGGLVNLIGRRSLLVGDDGENILARGERTHEEQLSFLVDVGLFGHYQIRPNQFVRVGYDVTYLTGLALAPENMGLGPEFPVLNSSGDNLYHGGTVGYEVIW